MSGVRTAAVITVGAATLAAFIGAEVSASPLSLDSRLPIPAWCFPERYPQPHWP